MDYSEPSIGTVVLSRAGRDKGKYFVVLALTEDRNYALIADGDLRKVAKPKKKKLMHLRVKPVAIPTVKERLYAGERIYDHELRRNLESLGYHGKSSVEDEKKE